MRNQVLPIRINKIFGPTCGESGVIRDEVQGPMAPCRNSPLANPFLTGTKTPRSSLSGKESLGRIPSISSLKSTVDRINSPGGRRSSIIANVGASENERPEASFQLGKHFYSVDDLSSLQQSAKRRSPRKLNRIQQTPPPVIGGAEVEQILAAQKALFTLRRKAAELIELGDLSSAHYWTKIIITEPSYQEQTHWSDYYRFFRISIGLALSSKLILEDLQRLEASRSLSCQLILLKAELLCKLEDWEGLVKVFDDLDLDSFGEDQSSSCDLLWEREAFPNSWVPSLSTSLIKARLLYFAGVAYRNLGDFEKAIDAFSQSTDYEPYMQVSVKQLICEQNALIPSAQRLQYLETLPSIGYSCDLETWFSLGKYEQVSAQTQIILTQGLLVDSSLLVLHLDCLFKLKRSEELFQLAHKLVDCYPQSGIAWYAVALYYEAIDRLDDSRRYLMKACSKDEHFGPAWLLLGHSFSRSGDHDQAVSSYALLARHLAPASVYPRLFLAMEFIKTKQIQSANLYLAEAFASDKNNPVIMNEVGALYCLQKNYPKGINMLSMAYSAWKRCPNDQDLAITILCNILSIYIKFIPHAQNPVQEVRAALAVVQELGKLAPLPYKAITLCAIISEIAATVCQVNKSEAYGRAADLYHSSLMQAKNDKLSLLGYNRCLVAKVQLGPIPPLSEDNTGDLDGDSEVMEEESGIEEEVPITPVKNSDDSMMDVESSPIESEQATVSRPATLRRRLTSLSFTQLEDESD